MAYESRMRFKEIEWYKNNIPKIKLFIESSDTFVKKVSDREFWLKEERPEGWEYDVRIFLDDCEIFIEASVTGTKAYRDDVKALVSFIKKDTTVYIDDV